MILGVIKCVQSDAIWVQDLESNLNQNGLLDEVLICPVTVMVFPGLIIRHVWIVDPTCPYCARTGNFKSRSSVNTNSIWTWHWQRNWETMIDLPEPFGLRDFFSPSSQMDRFPSWESKLDSSCVNRTIFFLRVLILQEWPHPCCLLQTCPYGDRGL